VLGIDQCPLRDLLLDLSQRPEGESFPESATLKKQSDKIAGFSLNES